MSWKVKYEHKFLRQAKKLDQPTRKRVKAWIDENLEGCADPRAVGGGKPLTATMSGYWRYRIGDYRLVTELVDSELIVVAVEVEHRSKVYKRR